MNVWEVDPNPDPDTDVDVDADVDADADAAPIQSNNVVGKRRNNPL